MSETNGATVKPTMIYGPVAIATGPGAWLDIPGWRPAACPALALTIDPRSNRRRLKRWSITHVPTGRAVFDDMAWSKALRVLAVLVEHSPATAWASAVKDDLLANKDGLMLAMIKAKRVYEGETLPTSTG